MGMREFREVKIEVLLMKRGGSYSALCSVQGFLSLRGNVAVALIEIQQAEVS